MLYRVLAFAALLSFLPATAFASSTVFQQTGALTAAAQTVPIALAGQAVCATTLTGTWVGTVAFEGSSDINATYNPLLVMPSGSGAPGLTANANGLYLTTVSALSVFRVRAASYTSGTVGVSIACSDGNTPFLGATPAGGSATATIAAAAAGPVVIKNSPGRFAGAFVTTTGTSAAVTFYDNASACSGTILAVVSGTATAGTATPAGWNPPAVNGITACGGTGSPAVTVSYY